MLYYKINTNMSEVVLLNNYCCGSYVLFFSFFQFANILAEKVSGPWPLKILQDDSSKNCFEKHHFQDPEWSVSNLLCTKFYAAS